MRRIVTRVLFLAASTLAFPGLAAAQTAPSDADRATARALAHEGYEAQKHEHYALAADRFERAEALVHAPTLLLGLARAQVGLGKLVEANETFRRILREPLAPGAPAPFASAVKRRRERRRGVAARLAWVTLMVNGPTAPEVRLDGETVPAAALGVRLACNPGRHALKASAVGFAPAEQAFALSEGGEQTIAMTLRALPEAPPAPVVEERPTPLQPAAPTGRRERVLLLAPDEAGNHRSRPGRHGAGRRRRHGHPRAHEARLARRLVPERALLFRVREPARHLPDPRERLDGGDHRRCHGRRLRGSSFS